MKKYYLYMAGVLVIAIAVVIGAWGVFHDKLPESVQVTREAAELEVVRQAGDIVARRMDILSKSLFIGIFIIQLTALIVGASVVFNIKDENSSAALKLKKLENADVFMDLPLYVGLFGTVSAFIIMAFNPSTSRLIAYSSTLVGIITSVVMRTSMIFPLRQKLLSEADKNK
jgi:hypothetical protein